MKNGVKPDITIQAGGLDGLRLMTDISFFAQIHEQIMAIELGMAEAPPEMIEWQDARK